MAKEYLKMADVFTDKVKSDSDCLLSNELGEIANFSGYKNECRYAAHAINSHDELVAEVERLRGELSAASSVLDEVDRVISERIKNGAYDLDDIADEVSHAIDRISGYVD